jgi:BirA family biotin operon repressor/biotin-[acetyl-CoA-carboxylase] ligase
MNVDDLLTAANLGPLLQGTLFGSEQKIHHFANIDSTNSAAMQAAAAGADEGSVFIAEEQLAGRGRGGHAWHSAPSTGIYLSAVLRPKLSPADVLWLSLVAGLSAHDAIRSVVGIAPDLRWPNDIMLGDKKLGGILTELNADLRSVNFAVVGIGINVNQPDFPTEIKQLATSLRIETDREWPRVEIAAALLESLDREYRALQENFATGATESIVRRFEQCSSYARGAHVQVHQSESQAGKEVVGYTGRTLGLDARGFLKIQTDAGVRTLISGGVRKVQGH